MWYTKRIKYGFLVGEYKPKLFYWEFVRIYKKMIIVFISNAFNFNRTYKLILIGLIIYVYFTVVVKLKPYKMIRFN